MRALSNRFPLRAADGSACGATAFFFVPEDEATSASFARMARDGELAPEAA